MVFAPFTIADYLKPAWTANIIDVQLRNLPVRIESNECALHFQRDAGPANVIQFWDVQYEKVFANWVDSVSRKLAV